MVTVAVDVVVVGIGCGLVFTVIIVRDAVGEDAADVATVTVFGCGAGDFKSSCCGSRLILCDFCGVKLIVCETTG